jgi:hypothetical protein
MRQLMRTTGMANIRHARPFVAVRWDTNPDRSALPKLAKLAQFSRIALDRQEIACRVKRSPPRMPGIDVIDTDCRPRPPAPVDASAMSPESAVGPDDRRRDPGCRFDARPTSMIARLGAQQPVRRRPKRRICRAFAAVPHRPERGNRDTGLITMSNIFTVARSGRRLSPVCNV